MPRAFTGRLHVEGTAKAAVDEMLTALRGRKECVQITPSKLVAWILERYYQNSFQRDQDAIVKAHFNSRDYIKRVIKEGGSEEDITNALREVLNKVKPASRPRKSGENMEISLTQSGTDKAEPKSTRAPA